MVDSDARQEQLEHLQSITGLESEAAANLLDAAGGELDIAVALHFNYEEGPRAGAAQADTGGMGPDSDSDDSDEGEILGSPNEQPLQRAAPPGRIGWVLKLLSSLPGYGIAVRILGLLTGTLGFLASIILTPLTFLGLVPTGTGPTGAEAIQRFESSFEERYGTTHPAFFRGTSAQALQDARRNLRFLLVYLHSDSQRDSTTFAQRVMSSALFSTFVDENMTFWVGDIATLEGRRMRQALRVAQLPALVVLAHGDMAPRQDGGRGGDGGASVTQALGSVQGPDVLVDERAVAQLNQIVRNFEPLLVAARADRHQLDFDRQMREEQAEEYARALAEDQAREMAEDEERTRAGQELQRQEEEVANAERRQREEVEALEARLQARRAKAQSLPDEPAQGSADACRVVVKLPDGQRLDRRFPKTCHLQAVADWVESASPEIFDFTFVSNYPRREFSAPEQLATSLSDLGLESQAMLFTKDISEE